jgi:hypothetical protein
MLVVVAVGVEAVLAALAVMEAAVLVRLQQLLAAEQQTLVVAVAGVEKLIRVDQAVLAW